MSQTVPQPRSTTGSAGDTGLTHRSYRKVPTILFDEAGSRRNGKY
ncbi:MAG: hypothetical protein WBV41_08185 [Terriglobales bacterium]